MRPTAPLGSTLVFCYTAAMPKTMSRAMSRKKPKLVIIDGNAIIHRAFHALPPLTIKDGTVVNAVYGFLNIIFKVIKELQPTHVAVVFDVKGPTFRHTLFKAYKATRKKQPDELYAQIPMVREAVETFGFTIYEQAGYEADDVIGTITKQVGAKAENYIVTGDMDILQLVNDHTFVYAMRKGVSDTITYTEQAVKDKYGGLTPQQIIDYKALRGDPSDNIPGIKGIGEKTAITLLNEYGTVENVLKHAQDLKGALRTKVESGKSDAVLSKELATIVQDVPVKFTLSDAEFGTYNRAAVIKLIQKYEFKSLLKFVEAASDTASEDVTTGQGNLFSAKPAVPDDSEKDYLANSYYTLVNDAASVKKLVTQLAKESVFAFDTETTALDPLQAKLVGFSICWQQGSGYYIPAQWVNEFKTLFENQTIKKVGHNIKFDVKVLRATSDINVAGIAYDTMLAAYVLNPGSRGYSLDALALTEFGYEMMPYESLVGKGKLEKPLVEVQLSKLAFYAAEDAEYTWKLYEHFAPQITKAKLETILTMEVQLIPVLADMEMAGVELNPEHLHGMSKELEREIASLEKKIYKIAGEEFNIASPRQLSEILFTKLKIDTGNIKKTKTGISTAASELEKMRGQHEIIDLISSYREVAKLKSTYVDALPTMVNSTTHRIHTNYNQTIAATGRLSSTDPNLQNIPIRTELGRKIRKAFIAPRGKRLVSLDYSQIELRIVAHIANDKSFIDGFKHGADVHTRTAAEVNNVSDDEVTKEMRRAAKSVNFGILYGMGVYGLSRDAGLSMEEARNYLEAYFEKHPAIRKYIDDTKTKVAKTGYAESMFGRRRLLPDIQSGMPVVRAAAERAAINMPIQGTASDLMKMAMLDVAQAITDGKVQATMLLQVHDELVFEVEADKVNVEAKKIKTIMEAVYTLKVPLVVDVAAGTNWMELDELTF